MGRYLGLKQRMTRFVAVIVAVAAIVAPVVSVAHAKDGRKFDNEHKSLLKVTSVAPGGETRHVKIGLNKSLVVELPRDVRDVLVSNPEFIDAVLHSSRRAYLIGKKLGEGNAFFFDKDGNRILTIEISISRDMGALSGMLNRILRDSDIKVDMVNEHLVLTGSVRTPIDSTKATDIAARFVKSKEEVINLLSTSGNEQVLLKVTVAEIQRNVAKKLGINLSAVAGTDGLTLNQVTNLAFPNVAQFIDNAIGSATTLRHANGADSITAAIRALERNGVLRTLAEPNLTAVSGETAKFLAGGEFPIPVGGDNDGIKIEFKQFGVALAFTPVVLDAQLISLKIATEVSDITNRGAVTVPLGNNGVVSIPAIEVRRASTSVELSSGGSIVMAGLISDRTKHNIDDLPELKRLPILGALFRSRDFVRNETELVVIVTPFLVNQTARNKLRTPDEGLGVPSDRNAFLRGHISKYDRRRRDEYVQVREEQSWSVKDNPADGYKPESWGAEKSRSWGRRSDREDGLGFIVE